MDRITESLLREFSEGQSLTALPEDKRFEHFASYVIIRRQYGETFDTSDVVIGSGGDTGLDAIAIIVNGHLVTDIEAFEELASATVNLDVVFIFVQADRSSSFSVAKIGQLGFGVLDFFRDTPLLPRAEAVDDAAKIMAAIYNYSSKFKRGNPACRMYYVTTGRWQNDAALEGRRAAAVADLDALQVFGEVQLGPVGAADNQTKNAVSREFQFPNRIVVPEISGVTEAYLGYISAPEFVSIIADDDDDILTGIFYDNVRDWQDYNPVNAAIRDTLVSDQKGRFILMNNGITIIARTLRSTGNKFHIEDFQIVNGCQTSHVIFLNGASVDETVMVPLRLIATQDEGVITSIIRATNQQTEVKREQFFAVTDFAKALEQFFESFPDGKQLYYERRSRQYDRYILEKVRIVTPPNVIRAFAGMFLEEPHRTTRSYASLQGRIGTDIFREGHRYEPYYVAAFSLYRLEYLFRNQRLDTKYKAARFHILLAARLIANPSPLPPMNSHQMERYCQTITAILHDSGKVDALLTQAANAVDVVAQGNFHRDNIRTQPFTERLIAHCAPAQVRPVARTRQPTATKGGNRS